MRLEQIRRDGWALTVDQVEQGLSGLAVAVNAGDETIAALSISGPSARWTVSVMRATVPEVLEGAQRISLRLAGDSSRSQLTAATS